MTRILQRTRELGTTTALDLSIPDMESDAGRCDWKAILQDWTPLCDIMVPSAEELFFFLHRDAFLAKKASLGPKEGVLDHMTVAEIAKMGAELIEMGTGIAMVKCGHRGLYVRTAGAERLEQFGAAAADPGNWADRELWFPVYEEEKFVGALGSGDSAIAGFLAAFVREKDLEDCLRYGNAAGSMNVTVPDGLTWNKGFDDLTRRIEGGWQTKAMQIAEPGWAHDGEFWTGPAHTA